MRSRCHRGAAVAVGWKRSRVLIRARGLRPPVRLQRGEVGPGAVPRWWPAVEPAQPQRTAAVLQCLSWPAQILASQCCFSLFQSLLQRFYVLPICIKSPFM